MRGSAATQGMIGHGLSPQPRFHSLQAPTAGADRNRRDTGAGRRSGFLDFPNPTKPVGPVLNARKPSWRLTGTSHETKLGPRRVVASPLPMEIIDLPVIQKLVDLHAVVICGGGGGVPGAFEKDQHFIGVPAVIDKDRVSALLGHQVATLKPSSSPRPSTLCGPGLVPTMNESHRTLNARRVRDGTSKRASSPLAQWLRRLAASWRRPFTFRASKPSFANLAMHLMHCAGLLAPQSWCKVCLSASSCTSVPSLNR